jgi:hypothetical protein
MKKVALALTVALVPALASAEDVWRWTDAHGVIHYSNVALNVPARAAVVDTPITLEVDRLPGAPAETGLVEAAVRPAPGGRSASRSRWLPDAPRIYDEARLRFGCYTAGVLYFGGFAQPDDIAGELNCYPYRLGPEAWLNAARAELAMRRSGVNPRDMARLYQEDQGR